MKRQTFSISCAEGTRFATNHGTCMERHGYDLGLGLSTDPISPGILRSITWQVSQLPMGNAGRNKAADVHSAPWSSPLWINSHGRTCIPQASGSTSRPPVPAPKCVPAICTVTEQDTSAGGRSLRENSLCKPHLLLVSQRRPPGAEKTTPFQWIIPHTCVTLSLCLRGAPRSCPRAGTQQGGPPQALETPFRGLGWVQEGPASLRQGCPCLEDAVTGPP